MELYCTRPGCARPMHAFSDLEDPQVLRTVIQRHCPTCGMPLLLKDRYLPSQLLGQGGFGAAYLARDRYTPARRQCVVKQFKPAGNFNPAQLQMAQDLFFREAEVLEKLGSDHPQIPDLLAFFDLEQPNPLTGGLDRFFYLVQEFIDGQTLEQEVNTHGPLSEADMLHLLQEVLGILTFVHSHESIHRDIKPSNIMRNQRGKVYLLDFGAIKFGTQGNASTSIYSQGYAPPEQMVGGAVFFSTDLYALAVTCIVAMTGQPPQALLDGAHQTWRWRERLPSPVSDHSALILDKMLAADPADRFASAPAVLQALATAPGDPLGRPAATRPRMPLANLTSPPLPRRFSTLELIGGAAFTGGEGALVGIGVGGVPIGLPLQLGLWALVIAGLIYLQFKRQIERLDLVIIGGVSLVAVALVFKPALPLLLSGLLGGALVAIQGVVIFRLVYKLLSRWLGRRA
jgi:serine/threonine protein kinase